MGYNIWYVLFVTALVRVHTAPPVAAIIGLFADDNAGAQQLAAAEAAVRLVNADLSGDFQLKIVLPTIEASDDESGSPASMAMYACRTANELFREEGALAVAVLGPPYSSQALLTGALAGTAGLPMLSYSASAPELQSTAQSLLRVNPSDAALAVAIADFLALQGWTRFAVVAQADTYGTGGLRAMLEVATARGSDVLLCIATALFDAEDPDAMSTAIRQVVDAPTQPRIIIAWVDDQASATFFEAVRAEDVLQAPYVWLATELVLPPVIPEDVGQPSPYAGLLQVRPAIAAPNRGSNAALSEHAVRLGAFLKEWRTSDPETYPLDALAVASPSQGSALPLLAALDPYVTYVHDAVALLGYGLHAAVAQQLLMISEPSADGTEYLSWAVDPAVVVSGTEPPPCLMAKPATLTTAAMTLLMGAQLPNSWTITGYIGMDTESSSGERARPSFEVVNLQVAMPVESSYDNSSILDSMLPPAVLSYIAHGLQPLAVASWTLSDNETSTATSALSVNEAAGVPSEERWQPQSPEIEWLSGSTTAPLDRPRLSEYSFRVLVPISPPFAYIVEDAGQSTTDNGQSSTDDTTGGAAPQLTGYVIDVMDELAARLGFEFEWVIGDPDATYNDYVMGVGAGREVSGYDLAIGDITATGERAEVVAFSQPIFYNGARIAVRKPLPARADTSSFLRPFSVDVWVVWLGMTLIGGLLTGCVERRMRAGALSTHKATKAEAPSYTESAHTKGSGGDEEEEEEEEKHTVLSWVWYGVSVTLTGGEPFEALSLAGRAIAGSMTFASIVLMAAYTGNMAATLTAARVKYSISDLSDITSGKVPTSRVGLIAEGDANTDMFVQTISPIFSPIQGSTLDALDALSEGQVDAFISDGPTLQYLIQNGDYCDLDVVGGSFWASSFAIVMPQDWLMADELNMEILSITTSGKLAELTSKYWGTSKCVDAASSNVDPNQLTLNELSGIFIMLGAMMGIVLLLWTVHALWASRCQRANATVPAPKPPAPSPLPIYAGVGQTTVVYIAGPQPVPDSGLRARNNPLFVAGQLGDVRGPNKSRSTMRAIVEPVSSV